MNDRAKAILDFWFDDMVVELVKNILHQVLNNDLNDLEQLRMKLHRFCIENANGTFPFTN